MRDHIIERGDCDFCLYDNVKVCSVEDAFAAGPWNKRIRICRVCAAVAAEAIDLNPISKDKTS